VVGCVGHKTAVSRPLPASTLLLLLFLLLLDRSTPRVNLIQGRRGVVSGSGAPPYGRELKEEHCLSLSALSLSLCLSLCLFVSLFLSDDSRLPFVNVTCFANRASWRARGVKEEALARGGRGGDIREPRRARLKKYGGAISVEETPRMRAFFRKRPRGPIRP